VPADVCPGSFDLKPEDAAKIMSARVFLIQPFQQPLAEKALKINPKIAVETIRTDDMTIPENYFRGIKEAENILAKYFPGMAGQFSSGVNSRVDEIRNAVINDMDYIQKVRKKNIHVLVSGFQAATARYLGLNVAGTFGGPESLKPKDLNGLLMAAKSSGATLIISNMTGTHDSTADILNKSLKIKKVVFIVFPGVSGNGSMFMNLWEYNLNQLKSALGE
jgi:zinc transport system substrate-binding protein